MSNFDLGKMIPNAMVNPLSNLAERFSMLALD